MRVVSETVRVAGFASYFAEDSGCDSGCDDEPLPYVTCDAPLYDRYFVQRCQERVLRRIADRYFPE